MKKRFFLITVFVICILFSASVNSVNAAEGWYEGCVVQGVGSQGSLGLVLVSGGQVIFHINGTHWGKIQQKLTKAWQSPLQLYRQEGLFRLESTQMMGDFGPL